MPGARRLAASLAELVAPPAHRQVIGPWRNQWRAHLAAQAASVGGGWLPWRWPLGVSRGDGHGPAAFRLLRDRPWNGFSLDLAPILGPGRSDRGAIAEALLPAKLLRWAAADPNRRAWALRIDVVGTRMHWAFAFYEDRVQQVFGRRWLDPARGLAYHDLLWRRSDRAVIRYLSEHLFAAILPLYDDLGIRRIGLTASLAAGGALWPAFGAVPTADASWRRLCEQIRWRFRQEPDAVRAEAADRIEARLAAGRHAVLDILNEASPFDPRGSRTLGNRLLAGTRYAAVIELDNPITRMILENRLRRAYPS